MALELVLNVMAKMLVEMEGTMRMLMEEKASTSSFSTEIALHLPEAAGSEESNWRGGRGRGSSNRALAAASAWAARCLREPLLADRSDDGDTQIARELKKTQ